ncbi:TIGR04076 family protein [Herbiconiux ginsengi]|uniref:TIGR04076 family protein n=1 Tax=Herbiconiux ginsengi TaxID=381665 RepID=A0A1H3KW60_9MICO|nr:TIGR04076 family protein [Herbiconiux ginsengi]SDY56361.1 TIGR04076 family protein [Herbiconiux ginsengi]
MTGRTVRCTVESMAYSACGLKTGDWFEVDADGLRLPDGLPFCAFAITTVLPLVNGRLDDDGADDWLASKPLVQCPDPPEALRMRLEIVQPAPAADGSASEPDQTGFTA